MILRRFWLVALFCAGCSGAAAEDGNPEDRGGELGVDQPPDAIDLVTPRPVRLERAVSDTTQKPTPDPWRPRSGIGKPTPDPWSSPEKCGTEAEGQPPDECGPGQESENTSTEAPAR